MNRKIYQEPTMEVLQLEDMVLLQSSVDPPLWDEPLAWTPGDNANNHLG